MKKLSEILSSIFRAGGMDLPEARDLNTAIHTPITHNLVPPPGHLESYRWYVHKSTTKCSNTTVPAITARCMHINRHLHPDSTRKTTELLIRISQLLNSSFLHNQASRVLAIDFLHHQIAKFEITTPKFSRLRRPETSVLEL